MLFFFLIVFVMLSIYSQTTTVKLVKKIRESFEGEVRGQKEEEVGREGAITKSPRSTKASAYSLCLLGKIRVSSRMMMMAVVAVV